MNGIKLSSKTRIRVLDEDQLDTIHDASLRILEITGVRFDSENARKRLLNSGASAHPTRKGVVTFPSSMVEEALRDVPQHVKYPGRERSHDIDYDGEHMFPYTGGGDPKMIDLDTGEIRPSTYDDVVMAARLGDALENNYFASSVVVANDAPQGLVVLRTFEATLKNSQKPMTEYAPDVENLDFLVKMAACVAGDEEALTKRPFFSISGSPSSPLTYAENNCEVLLRCAEKGIPYQPVPCPICGETGPMSIAGAMAQQNAETLAGIMLIQTVTTKLPVIYSGRVCFMDPRFGRDLWGIPEEGLVNAGMVQLARRYGMVSDVSGMASDITRWDMQMGFECMMTVMLSALAGAESISGVGGGWEGASSLEMMVVGNEVFHDIARIMQGIEIDEKRLGLDVLEDVGHMGSFIAKRHTMDNIRAGELRIPSLWDKRTSTRAAKEGCMPLQEAAREKVKVLLSEHEPEPLDGDVVAAIDAVVREAARSLTR